MLGNWPDIKNLLLQSVWSYHLPDPIPGFACCCQLSEFVRFTALFRLF